MVADRRPQAVPATASRWRRCSCAQHRDARLSQEPAARSGVRAAVPHGDLAVAHPTATSELKDARRTLLSRAARDSRPSRSRAAIATPVLEPRGRASRSQMGETPCAFVTLRRCSERRRHHRGIAHGLGDSGPSVCSARCRKLDGKDTKFILRTAPRRCRRGRLCPSADRRPGMDESASGGGGDRRPSIRSFSLLQLSWIVESIVWPHVSFLERFWSSERACLERSRYVRPSSSKFLSDTT